jgi:4-amino-4-deoxychorismate lyase
VSGAALDSLAVAQGVGLFETLLVRRGSAVQVDAHFERLRGSARTLRLPVPSRSTFDDAVSGALGTAAPTEASLRVVWTCTGAPLDDPRSWTLHAGVRPIPGATLARRQHGRVMVLSPAWQRALPAHKTTSYAVCVLALREAVRQEADEALFVDPQGGVREGSTTNVFGVRGDTVVTPPLSAGLLPGVTRAWVMTTSARAPSSPGA